MQTTPAIYRIEDALIGMSARWRGRGISGMYMRSLKWGGPIHDGSGGISAADPFKVGLGLVLLA
jgi:hypothetical protein